MIRASAEQIALWKQEYGKIFSVEAFGVSYVFRPLRFAEYDTATGLGGADSEEYVVSAVLLHPTDCSFDDLPAGLVSSLAEEILSVSSFSNPKQAKATLEYYRQRAEDPFNLMKAYIIAAMPAYKEEDLEPLTFEELAAKLVLAEQIIKLNQAAFNNGAETTIEIIDPEEEALKAKQSKGKKPVTTAPGVVPEDDPIAARLFGALGADPASYQSYKDKEAL